MTMLLPLWIVAIGRSDRLVRPAIEKVRHSARGWREHRLSIDVVTGELGASRSMGEAVPRLQNVKSVALSRADVVVIDELTVSTLTDQPFVRQWRGNRYRIDCRSVGHHELDSDEKRSAQHQEVGGHPRCFSGIAAASSRTRRPPRSRPERHVGHRARNQKPRRRTRR